MGSAHCPTSYLPSCQPRDPW
ncbi:MAG: hypothetical protein E6I80_10205 [Chloroflexi bacterium]|nr:MAG: hypothetical protein E6I80_10205 [Chloroflexota bacterium]